MTRRLIAATASAVLILGLAACDDGKGPVTTPPPDLGFEPQTSDGGGDESGASDGGGDGETQAAPDIPAPDRADFPGMNEHTEEGALQAFRYYIAVSMWAHQTGETEELHRLEEAACKGCQELNEAIEPMKEHGEYWSKFDVTEVGTRIYDSEHYDVEVAYFFTISPHTRPNDSFDGRFEAPEVEYISTAGMKWSGDGWTVKALDAEWGEDVHN
ncbi:DUF6318 family protein [Brachybacterium sp. UMB0905]|uniref:DUF6318 family protein n=1 Tax=Brachybacterium sp. UMB0905 TaxID=2069310 RepID=UPI000C80D0A2|nr:DUF6318 family protein [Brachybacterium sp. UMB0905]PMC74494.1 hypothetical protein CJ197_13370 [Brachybacterium sp. UMB0905]